MTTPVLRVAIVEDDRATREGLKLLVDSTPGFSCVGTFHSAEDALRANLPADRLPTVVLLDVHLPGMSGTDAVPRLRERWPDTLILMLTVFAEDEMVFASLCRGASGYLLKKTAPARLLDAIREASEGGAPMSPEIARKVIRVFTDTSVLRDLTPRAELDVELAPAELRLLQLLAEGYSYRGAGEALHVSINTIRGYIRSIYEKLHVHSKSAAVSKALKAGLITSVLLCAALAIGAGVARADTNTFSIAVPLLGLNPSDPQFSYPYPSAIFAESRRGPATTGPVSVVLHKVTHPCPEDLAVLLVSPGGSQHLLMSNAGGCRALQGTDITIRTGLPALPDADPVATPHGTSLEIGPSNYGAAPVFPAPAPAGPYLTSLPASALLQGTWNLFVIDTHPGNRGVIAGGWTLAYQTDIQALMSPAPVSIPIGSSAGGRASVYPITFDFSSVMFGTKVQYMTLHLRVSHTFPDDLRIVLQSPDGTAVVVMANAGGDFDLVDHGLFFSDGGASFVPDNGPIVGSDFKPGSFYGGPPASLPSPAPAAPYGLSFANFTGQEARGLWRLWVYDSFDADGGSIVDGSLTINTENVSFLTIDTPSSLPSVTVNQPFVRVEGTVENTGWPRNVTWRNVTAGGYYDSGAMFFNGPTRVYADIPLRKGENVITFRTYNTQGNDSQTTLRVTANEFTYYLSEGATGGFFDEQITLANPGTVDAPATIEFLPEHGPPVPFPALVRANTPLQVSVNGTIPADAVSAVVHSENAVPLAVERTMSWDASGYGGHGGTSVRPHERWLFAEGSQGYFDTFVLLANDNTTSVDATIRFLLEGGGAVTHHVLVPAHARVTVYTGDIPALRDMSFGIDVSATQPIIVERSMYFPHGSGRTFEGGHESAGVNATSTFWLLAEGATGPFFDTFVLLTNPTGTLARTTLTYLLPSGDTITQNVDVPANGRATINIETVDPRLTNTPVSTTVFSTAGIIVERSMYWPDISEGWREAHNSLGVTDGARRWAVADGRLGGPRGHQTYILLANPNFAPAEVQVSFFKDGVRGPSTTLLLPATSRRNIWVNDEFPGLGDGVFSADVQVLNFQSIVVEKAMYWNSGGAVWAAGTGVVATQLPPP